MIDAVFGIVIVAIVGQVVVLHIACDNLRRRVDEIERRS